jgi:hypothetical protein
MTMTSFPPTTTDPIRSVGHVSLVVAYEDYHAGKRAQSTCQQIINLAHGEGMLSMDLWKFDMLRMGPMRESAIAEAAKADLVVLAPQDELALASSVMDWVRLILKQPTQPKALLVLLEPEPAEPAPDSPIEKQLREFAAKIPLWCLRPTATGEWWEPEYDTADLAQIAQEFCTPLSETVSAA